MKYKAVITLTSEDGKSGVKVNTEFDPPIGSDDVAENNLAAYAALTMLHALAAESEGGE